MGNNII